MNDFRMKHTLPLHPYNSSEFNGHPTKKQPFSSAEAAMKGLFFNDTDVVALEEKGATEATEAATKATETTKRKTTKSERRRPDCKQIK